MPLAPRKAYHELAWRLVGLSKKVLRERRRGHGPKGASPYEIELEALRTQLTASLPAARLLAAQWREAALGTGGFVELDINGD